MRTYIIYLMKLIRIQNLFMNKIKTDNLILEFVLLRLIGNSSDLNIKHDKPITFTIKEQETNMEK
jgi:hypothetical protein